MWGVRKPIVKKTKKQKTHPTKEKLYRALNATKKTWWEHISERTRPLREHKEGSQGFN